MEIINMKKSTTNSGSKRKANPNATPSNAITIEHTKTNQGVKKIPSQKGN